MREAILKAGLVTPELYQALNKGIVQEELRRSKDAMQRVLREQSPNLTKLEAGATVSEFRSIAQAILTEEPDRISDVLRIAHNLMGAEGGKRLVWQLFQIRDFFNGTSDTNARVLFTKRALRRAGGLGSKNHPVKG